MEVIRPYVRFRLDSVRRKKLIKRVCSTLGTKNFIVPTNGVTEHEKLLTAGIWCKIMLSYLFEDGQKQIIDVLGLKTVKRHQRTLMECLVLVVVCRVQNVHGHFCALALYIFSIPALTHTRTIDKQHVLHVAFLYLGRRYEHLRTVKDS